MIKFFWRQLLLGQNCLRILFVETFARHWNRPENTTQVSVQFRPSQHTSRHLSYALSTPSNINFHFFVSPKKALRSTISQAPLPLQSNVFQAPLQLLKIAIANNTRNIRHGKFDRQKYCVLKRTI
jgi:hypothetical protein